jgi:tetratricopeptide (TPR) repeat protein
MTSSRTHEDAESAARRALAAAGDSPAAWHHLALALIGRGKLAEARAALEKVVALAPRAVEALNNLGIVRQRLGELEAARDAYEGALRLDPENAATHSNLASVLGELGEYEPALDHARRALMREPGMVAPNIYAALAEVGLGRHAAALYWLDCARSLAPDNVSVLVARADTLRRLDRAEEAFADCRQALALAPENGEAWNTQGLICHALGQDDDAIMAFDQAARFLPRPGTALANKAAVLLELGRGSEAAAALDRALAAEPDLAAAWYARADAKSFATDDPDIIQMEKLLERLAPRAAADRLLLHYALGKAYLDIKDAPRAFQHLNAGSRLKRATLHYDAVATEGWMASTPDAFPAGLIAAFADAGEPSEAPIFILGMPRSGTTLVQQILAALPGVYAAGEPRFVEELVGELGPAYPSSVGLLQRAQFAALGERYLARARASVPADARRIIDKMPNNFLHAGLIHLMLPGAHIIHCRRDAVDTCLSCYSKLFTTGQEFSYDLVELGRYYRGYEKLMAHWRAVLPRERFLDIDYENIIAGLEGEARRLLAFCGLDWDPACLSFHKSARPIRTASMNQVRRPLYATSVRRWEAFRDELRPLLDALGITPE